MNRTAQVLIPFSFLLASCGGSSSLQTEHHSHQGGVALSSLTGAVDAQTLDALRQLTAPFHDIETAKSQGYVLFIKTPLTAPDGCISSMQDGGMGYHYTRGKNLGDDSVALLDPEFLVYAPKNGPRKDGEARTRLAAFDYFIPYSAKWPSPDSANFKRAPTLQDFSTMKSLPAIAFAPSRFGGWMFHIWLWEENPKGMFANWNPDVPLCEGSTF